MTDENNGIYQLLLLQHLKNTQQIRLFVAEELKKVITTEKDLSRRNLLQAAVDLLEFNKLITVNICNEDINKQNKA